MILHFIGSEPIGGHRRYAQILDAALREWDLSSEVFESIFDISRRAKSQVASSGVTLVFHSFDGVAEESITALRQLGDLKLIAYLHNPQYNRLLPLFDLVIPVSEYVKSQIAHFASLLNRVADPAFISMDRLVAPDGSCPGLEVQSISRNSEYVWNHRKIRDRLLSHLEKLNHYPFQKFGENISFEEAISKPVVQIGVISRFARLKQLPTLVKCMIGELSEDLAVDFRLHLIGAGPWRVVHELKSAIPARFRSNVYFWGWQPEAQRLMRSFDAIVLGMPEKEALGLNVLEATSHKVPVIGIDGGPFREVIEPGRNGWLISREHPSRDFESILETLFRMRHEPSVEFNFEMSSDFKHRFSEQRFREHSIRVLS